MLTPADIIKASALGPHPGVYVIGCYDSRITFYSQQVRGLELARALQHEHLLPADAAVAVIGGGAAGLAVAAGLALQGGTNVHLFEKAPRLLPLQGDSDRRRLDPHIYEWPRHDAEHELAELPLLDWRSGPAKQVRDAVLREFGEVRTAVDDRLTIRERHQVMAIEPQNGRYLVSFEREGANGVREEASQEFQVIVLAIGFGLENRFALPGTDTPSYWHDAGVPGAEIAGNARPTFLVSGNGDGGLIDLIAAASANFRHDDIVRGIAQRPGVKDLREPLLVIDADARAAEALGQGFDFVTAYDNAIGAQVEALGLVDQIQGQLRPGVQLFLQTREPELLSVKTARLNRLAVYLLTKACARPIAENFQHVVCDEVVQVPSHAADPHGSRRFTCGATTVVADWVIARRGPGRDHIRQPFANLLAGFDAAHDDWIRAFPQDSIAPELSQATRDHFKRLATQAKLPPPRYHIDAMIAAMPRSAKLWLSGDEARWSGDVAPDDVATLWGDEGSLLELTVIPSPEELGTHLAHAVARLAIHAPRVDLRLDVARWRPFLDALSIESPSACDLHGPGLKALGGNPSIIGAVAMPPHALAATINGALDNWLLDRLDRHLVRYLEHGEDPGHPVQFVAAGDLRQQMRPIWQQWVDRFGAEPDLLARFLGLAVCAKDEAAAAGEASVLSGRLLLTPLIRACAVALAVATAWQVTGPRAAHPGNLARDAAGTERTGHTCAAALIDSEVMAVVALRHAWTTEFVLLPMQDVPAAVIAGANSSLDKGGRATPLLGQPGAEGKLMLTLDVQFRTAAQAGAGALAAYLIDAEERHYARLKAAIEAAGGIAP